MRPQSSNRDEPTTCGPSMGPPGRFPRRRWRFASLTRARRPTAAAGGTLSYGAFDFAVSPVAAGFSPRSPARAEARGYTILKRARVVCLERVALLRCRKASGLGKGLLNG